MTIYNQPDAVAFASDPKPSEIATFTAWARGLGIAFDETNGFPQMEGINDVLNRITQGIKYLEQYGIPLWRSDLEYPVGASVVYNGIQYRCIAQNTNAQPDLSQNSWQSAIVDNLTSTSTTLALSAKQGKAIADMLKTDANTQWVGGIMIQWGTVVGIKFGANSIKFNKNFPNNALCVVASNASSGNASSNIIKAYLDKSNINSSFICDVKNYGNIELTDVSWIAVGN